MDATFIGDHQHDRALPDWSEAGLRQAANSIAELLTDLDALPQESLSPIERVDRRLARGQLRIESWELGSSHFQRGNPAAATGEAVFGALSLLLSDFAPLDIRCSALADRLRRVPAFLEQARALHRVAPRPWTERAVRECTGALAFLDDGLPRLDPLPSEVERDLADAASTARAAFVEHREVLAHRVPDSDAAEMACGPEVLDLLVRDGHMLEMGAHDILRYAERECAEAKGVLAERVREAGYASADDVADALSEIGPDAERYLARYDELWAAMRERARAADLLSWPDFPIRYRPRPDWAREAAPYLYFLFYRSPAAFGRPPVHEYLVTPIDDETAPSERAALLRAHNDSVLKLNHVIHHGGIGHHVQNWHAFRAPSRVGRIAAVDGPSRIALFCGGTMAEGWACYATDLMAEHGALTPLEEVAEARSRIRMCVRAIVDVSFHLGERSFEECVDLYRREAAMPEAAARAEVIKNSMFPGAALMYLMGTDGVHQARREERARKGADFSLREFHDRFLSFGSIPVALVRRLLSEEAGGTDLDAPGPPVSPTEETTA